MASLLEQLREQEAKKTDPLAHFQPEVTVDGSLVTVMFDMQKLAEVSKRRKGEKEVNGTKEEYTKAPGIMLDLNIPGIQITETDPKTGKSYLVDATFRLGQGGKGAYATINGMKLIGEVQPA